MINLLDYLKEANFNTIMFQVRARGDLLYPSLIEPWGKSMTGTLGSNPGWDVLSFVIQEAHARGMEVHAWFVTYRVWDSSTQPPVTSPLHVVKSYPEYCKTYVEGTSTSWWLDPGIPAVRTYLRNIISEMVSNYNLDGIHFDYIRYPDASFDDAATYATYGGGMNKDDWRRNNITQFVAETYSDIQAIKPMLKVGSAPIGIYKNIPGQGYNWEAYYDIYQASREWLQAGTHDYLSPQIYWDIATIPQFNVVLRDWMGERYGRHIYAGIAVYRMGSAKSNKYMNCDNQDFFKRVLTDKADWSSQEILNQIDTSRAVGAFGQVYFSTSDIDENVNSIHTLMKQNQYLYPANIPPMAWKDNIAPNSPQALTISLVSANNYRLRWTKPVLPADNDTVKYYNVYMSDIYPIDISDIKNVVAFQVTDTTVIVDSGTSSNRYFTVTAYDKGYNESVSSNTVGSVNDVDILAPVTQLSYTGTWQTTDFNVAFSDNDPGGSGIAHSFYQATDFDGTEWRANSNYGFFNDNFQSAIHPDWVYNQGAWNINTQSLNQTDEANANTNIYASLTQTHGDIFLYTWKMKIGGSGTNLRAGIHFYCSDASQSDRDDSYMIYFRTNGNTSSPNTCQIFQYIDNTFVDGTYLLQTACTVIPNIWYDYSLIYNSTTGYLEVYQNNNLVTTYTFANPHTFNASGISFRSGNANVFYDDLMVYKKRASVAQVTVGTSNEVRFSNPNPSTPACKINNVLKDNAGNWSQILSESLYIDYSAPQAIATVQDGIGTDINEIYENELLSASWTQSADANSGIVSYQYCLETSPGQSNVVAWTSSGTNTSIVYNGVVTSVGQAYYTSVKAINGAGLESVVSTSNGVIVVAENTLVASFNSDNTIICEGEIINFTSTSQNATSYQWIFPGGTPSSSTLASQVVMYPSVGNYNVTMIAANSSFTDTVHEVNFITVNPKPVADFTANATSLQLPNAIATFVNNSLNANQYDWNFGDAGTSTGTAPYHIYNQTGIFTVTLISKNTFCPADTLVKEDYITVEDLSSIINTESSDIFVYPNPAMEFLTIEGIAFGHVETINLQGKIVLSMNISKPTSRMNISDLSTGIYYLKIYTADRFIVKMIVIQ